jgi:hypothetical protein
MTIQSRVEMTGLADIQRRVAQLGLNLKPNALRRPGGDIGAEMVLRTKKRLGSGRDVNGVPLRSKRSAQLGLEPLGGSDGRFGQSTHWSVDSDGVDLFSTFIGAGVAYRGDVITPKVKKFLTIPLRARGGDFASKARRVRAEKNTTGRRARHYSKGTFVLRRAGGKLVIVQKTQGGALRALFLLVKKIRYPKNEWLGYAADDLKFVLERYGRHLDTFEGKGGGK